MNRKRTIIRLCADLGLCVVAITLPWWFSFGIALASVFYFGSFWELICIGIILDFLYSAPVARFYNFQFVLSFSALLLFVLVNLLKKRLRV